MVVTARYLHHGEELEVDENEERVLERDFKKYLFERKPYLKNKQVPLVVKTRTLRYGF